MVVGILLLLSVLLYAVPGKWWGLRNSSVRAYELALRKERFPILLFLISPRVLGLSREWRRELWKILRGSIPKSATDSKESS